MRKSLLLALSLLGGWDSVYLWWVYTSASRPMLCLGTGCDVVRASSYARLGGLPLPAYGAAMYATLALLVLAESIAASRPALWIRYATAIVSGAGFLVSLVLTGIEAFVLHAWCAWCVVSAFAVTFIFALALPDVIRPMLHEFDPPPRTLRRQATIFLIALGVGTPAFLLLARHGRLPPPEPVLPVALADRLVRPESHVAENPQASVTVVEFGDFQCSVCGRVQPVVEEVRRKYGHQIRFVFRQFPISAIHMHAETSAEASECAGEQGKFWEAVAKLYNGQSDLSEPAIDRYAAELGLDMGRFRECRSSRRMADRLKRDLEDGRALGVHGTPTFFIGRQRVEGPIDLGQFSRWIDQELASHGAPVAQASSPATGATTKTDPMSGTTLLASNPANAFTQFQSSALACSEEEAKKRQPTLIRTPEVQEYFKSGSEVLFVDVRPSKDFRAGRIRGAINIPVDEIEQRWGELPKDRKIVIYESGLSPGDVCASSRAAARVLLAHGFPSELVKVYQDGFAAWGKAGLPVNR